jgi:tRNA(Arg) A34 adenosine deaminase TadA
MMKRQKAFMKEAVLLSQKGLQNNEGGPFGCVIVKDNEIIGRGNNKVTSSSDPTAHAEIIAIREACKNLGTFQLNDCEIYTSCEPCPMCLGAIYWARIKTIYFANSREDAAAVGFDDSMIYDEMNADLKSRKIPMINIADEEAKKVFDIWLDKKNRIIY